MDPRFGTFKWFVVDAADLASELFRWDLPLLLAFPRFFTRTPPAAPYQAQRSASLGDENKRGTT